MKPTRRLFLTIVCLLMMISLATPPAAYAAMGCFGEFDDCMRQAAHYGWWDSILYALDCELEFIACVRGKVMGW